VTAEPKVRGLRVTVIIPVRNGESFLRSLLPRISSLLTEDIEVVLVDDASLDDTGAVLAEFARTHQQVKLIHNATRLGVAESRNRALSLARGDYVWFADADDSWSNGILATLLEEAKAHDADVVICGADLRTHEAIAGPVIDGRASSAVVNRAEAWKSLSSGEIHGYLWNKLFRRQILGSSPFELLSSQSDFTGVVKAVRQSERIVFVPDVLYHHIVQAGSITRQRTPELSNLESAWRVFEHEYGSDPIGELSPADIAYFKCWFVAMPLAHTPTRVGAAMRVRRQGLALARATLRSIDMNHVRRRSPTLYARACAISYTWDGYLALLLMMRALKANKAS
jgi:hypothetical protein